jgi:type III restriction enzyme
VYREVLRLDLEKVEPLRLDASTIATITELAPVVDGQPDVTRISEIDLMGLARKFRLQKIAFEAARDIFEQMRPAWKGTKEYLLAQVIRFTECFINSDKIIIEPALFARDELRRRLVLTLSMNKVVQHIWEAIRSENTETLEPVFDRQAPVRSTGQMRPWYTSKPCHYTKKSHINFCVFDSTWEATEAFRLDHSSLVEAWVKNDHLGFSIPYIYQGVVRKYRPDFLIQLKNGGMLVLEVKGKETDKDKTKRRFLEEWVKAVNAHGGFGFWQWAVSRNPADIDGILEEKYRVLEEKYRGIRK